MKKVLIPLNDKRFGRLTVVSRVPRNEGGHAIWKCRCDCGSERKITSDKLRSGNTRSCGCLKTELQKLRLTTHGKSHLPEYSIWCAIKNRCNNPNDKDYKYYGGRGIRICKSWDKDFESFFNFLGVRPFIGAEIDRINNDGNYKPGNVRWATHKQQMQNSRPFLKANGRC